MTPNKLDVEAAESVMEFLGWPPLSNPVTLEEVTKRFQFARHAGFERALQIVSEVLREDSNLVAAIAIRFGMEMSKG